MKNLFEQLSKEDRIKVQYKKPYLRNLLKSKISYIQLTIEEALSVIGFLYPREDLSVKTIMKIFNK